jgi:hypothetical protein
LFVDGRLRDCGAAAALPKLETLVLTNNRLVNLVDLDPLGMLVNLQTLCLLDNLVTKKPQYRFYLINKLPKLRLLDFKKVKLKVYMNLLVFPPFGSVPGLRVQGLGIQSVYMPSENRDLRYSGED